MKKVACLLIAVALMLQSGCVLMAKEEVPMTVNGQTLSVHALRDGGAYLVPARQSLEALGMTVFWEAKGRTITAVHNRHSLTLAIGSKAAEQDGEALELSAAPAIINGTTYLALDDLARLAEVTTGWDEATQSVVATEEDTPSDDSWKENTGTISLDDQQVTGQGVSVSGNEIRITQGGDFTVTGTLTGMISVNTDSRVKLRLAGCNIYNPSGPAIFFENCDKAYITIVENTTNTLTDGTAYTVDAKGALFSNDDLEIKGGGTLQITGQYRHGIACDDKLSIENGAITVKALQDGIHANDGVTVSGGTVTITAEGDGIHSEGFVSVTGGTIDITTTGEVTASVQEDWMPGGFGGGRGQMQGQMPEDMGQMPQGMGQRPQGDMQPPQGMERPQGDMQPPQGMGQRPQLPVTETTETAEDTVSSKGIKAETNLLLLGGTTIVQTTDHAVHSAGFIGIAGGDHALKSSVGKGVSGHGDVYVAGGIITVDAATEGIESKQTLVFSSGDVQIDSREDGLNTGGGMAFGMQNSDEHQLLIHGGTITIDAEGDGIDGNGKLYITGGTITINGPVSSGNGALDAESGIEMTGGTLWAVGSAGMLQMPGQGSTQPMLAVTFNGWQTAPLRLTDAGGNTIATFTPGKNYQSLVYSSPTLEQGKTYHLYVGDALSQTLTADVGKTTSGGRMGMGGRMR